MGQKPAQPWCIIAGVVVPIGDGSTVSGSPASAPMPVTATLDPIPPAEIPGIVPVVSAALESSHILKAAPGNLFSCYCSTTGTPGWLLIFNAIAAPADGAVTPIDAIELPAQATAGFDCNGGPPEIYSIGITAVFSTTGPFVKTASATAFFNARVV